MFKSFCWLRSILLACCHRGLLCIRHFCRQFIITFTHAITLILIIKCNLIQYFTTGLMFTFSMYYFPLLNEFGSSRSYTATVGSVQNGVYMLAGSLILFVIHFNSSLSCRNKKWIWIGPLTTPIIQWIGLRPAIMLSGLITCTGYALSSLAPDLNILLITYGIIGGCLSFESIQITIIIVKL